MSVPKIKCLRVGRYVPRLPSWVPDWSFAGRTIISSYPEDYVVIQHNPSGGLTQTFLRPLDGNRLELDVIVLDENDMIRHLGPVFERPPPSSDKSTTFMDLGLKEAFWRTLIGNIVPFFKRLAPAVYGIYYLDFLWGDKEVAIQAVLGLSGYPIEGQPADPGERIRLLS